MIDSQVLLATLFSNVCVAAGLAGLAWWLQARQVNPRWTHLLWILALVKLLTPALITLPVVDVSAIVESNQLSSLASFEGEFGTVSMDVAPGVLAPLSEAASEDLPATNSTWGWRLLGLWGLGGVAVGIVSVLRIARFHRLLRAASAPAPGDVLRATEELVQEFGLSSAPRVFLSSAQLPPMIWWWGGRLAIYLPDSLVRDLHQDQLRWILAHEIAHLHRRDHWVRVLEWLTSIVCWWNPLAWWIRRELRVSEELCCDALVLSRLRADSQTYAHSLLAAVESLAGPALRPPALASLLFTGGTLERRFRMIVSHQFAGPLSRWRLGAAAFFAVAVLPIGIVQAQAPDIEAVGDRLVDAVRSGELEPHLAEAMMAELARAWFTERLHHEESHQHHEHDGHDHDDGWEDYAGDDHHDGGDERDGHDHDADDHDHHDDARDADEHHRRAEARERRAYFGAVERELHEAVRAGKLSEEDAHRKLEALHQELFGDHERHEEHGEQGRRAAEVREKRMYYGQVERELHEAVHAGKLSEEDAHRKLQAIREELFGENGHHDGNDEEDRRAAEAREKRMHYGRIEREIHEAVHAGKLSEEDAHRKLEALRKELFVGRYSMLEHRDDVEHGFSRLVEALERGEMSYEDAERILKGQRETRSAEHGHHGEREHDEEGEDDGEHRGRREHGDPERELTATDEPSGTLEERIKVMLETRRQARREAAEADASAEAEADGDRGGEAPEQ